MVAVSVSFVRRVAAIVAAMLVVLVTSGKSFASVPRPNADRPFVDPAGRMTMFVDPSAAMTVDDVVDHPERFQPSPKPVPTLGVSAAALWARVEVEPGEGAFFAELNYPQFDDVTFVVEGVDGARRVVRSGDMRPFRERDQPETNFVFEVREPARALFVRVASTGTVAVPLTLWEPRAYHRHVLGERLLTGLYLGVIAAMAAYNLFLLFLLRDRVYGYYVGFLVAFLVFELSLTGLGFQYFWSESVWLQAHSSAIGMTTLAWLLFRVCMTAVDAKKHLPRLGKAYGTVDVFFGTLSLLAFFVPPRLVIASSIFIGPIGGAIVVAALVARVRQGSTPARYMLAGNVALIASLSVFAANRAGLLPENPIFYHLKDVGVVSQVVLLSLALAARIRSLQAEVARNQRTALEASKRTNDELAHLNQLKDDFLANTSHELRTPLNGILGLAESLVSGSPDGATKRTAELILTSGRRLSTIVDDVLAFATLRKEGASVAREPVDLGAVVDQVRDVYAAQASEKKLVLVVDKQLADRGVLGETAKLEQVLHHLVGNAVKFTEKGSVTVAAHRAGERVRIAVSDTGPGIDDATRARLFSAFEQADGSAQRELGGLGLGLPLAKRIVELLGGDLVVESSPGKGSVFSFELDSCERPAAASTAESVHVPSRGNVFAPVALSIIPPAPPPSSGSKEGSTSVHVAAAAPPSARFSAHMPIAGLGVVGRVLAVDDEPINLAVLARQLGNEGFEVVKASNGPEAIEKLKSESFDIVLLDVMMPRMSGYDVCRVVRRELGLADLPVVLVTAKTQEQDLVDGFDCGANDYIRKPFTKGELVARVHAHVREARTRRAIGRFVPREFLRLLGREQVTDVQLGDQVEREISVLFSDIRDFTKLCESLTPDDTFRFINRCLERLGPEVRAHGGFIDKYIGDAIMALFPAGGIEALRAAIAMQKAVDAFNTEEPVALPLAIGIGVHRGKTMLGTIGEEERMEATVVSDTVNVASRLEGLTKSFGARVIVSGALVEEARTIGLTLRPLGHVSLKGRGIPVEVFEVLDADADGLRWAKVASLDVFSEAVALHESGRHEEARALFMRVLERCPEDRAAQHFLGESGREREAPAQSLVKGA
jgi:signal transduction histidine kinase/class 3 adenylate cyclase